MFQETIFAQIMRLIDHKEFNKCVERYHGDEYIKELSCYDQFLCMLFSQLASRKSLRANVFCLQNMKHKLYHMGFRCKNISLNALSNANQKRNWRIYRDYAQTLIERAQKLYANEEFDLEVKENVYAFDATIIALCLTFFPWADFRSTKSGIKLHMELNVKSNVPKFMDITPAAVADVKKLDELEIEKGSIYVIDRGYLDFSRLWRFEKEGAFFIIREKKNTSLRRVYSRPVDKGMGLKCDQRVMLCSKKV